MKQNYNKSKRASNATSAKYSPAKNSEPKSAKYGTLRVQSGYLRGKILAQPASAGTRPTKSIVKACVFNILRSELADAEFIEAFGGSASMAIEAISNNAARASCCELDPAAVKIARANCADLPIAVHHADVFSKLAELIANAHAAGLRAIVYLDPPFSIRDGFASVYERLKTACNGADLIIFEHESAVDVALDGFTCTSRRKFGKSSISTFLPIN